MAKRTPCDPLSVEDARKILRRAKRERIKGFGGRCFEASIAINQVLFCGLGEYVGAFNTAVMQELGIFTGHMSVLYGGRYWDTEGDHSWKEIDKFGIANWGIFAKYDDSVKTKKIKGVTKENFTEKQVRTMVEHASGSCGPVDPFTLLSGLRTRLRQRNPSRGDALAERLIHGDS